MVAALSTAALLLTGLVAPAPAPAQEVSGADLAAVCPPVEPVADVTFGEGGVHEAAIDCLAQFGVVDGLDDGTFGSSEPLRRDQMASIIRRYLAVAVGEPLPDEAPDFADVDPDNVHAASIGALAAVGIVAGFDTTTFDPAGIVTRAQMATFVARTLDYLDDGAVNGSFPPAGYPSFEDVVAGSTHAANIDALVALGVVLGVGEGRFGPGQPVLRGQVMTFFARSAAVLLGAGNWAPGPGHGGESDEDVEPDVDDGGPVAGPGGTGGNGGSTPPPAGNTPPAIDPIDGQTATEDEAFGPLAIVVSDADGDDVTLTVEGLPAGLAYDADTGTIGGTPDIGTAGDSPYTITVTAADGEASTATTFVLTVGQAPDTTAPAAPPYSYAVVAVDEAGNTSSISNVVNVTPEAPAAPACPLVSILACDQVPVALPFTLDWTSDEGGLDDVVGTGTGFTMVDPPSSRLDVDGVPSSADAPGYEPSRLTVDEGAGTFTIRSTKGIKYASPLGDGSDTTSTDTNSQINGLGVGVDATTAPLVVSAAVVAPTMPTANQFEQTGVWFGLGEDDYVKLAVRNAPGDDLEVELLVEVDSDVGEDDSIVSDAFAQGQDVELILSIDPQTQAVSGSYRLGDAPAQVVGTRPLPSAFTDGVTLSDEETGPVSFAGLFATNRRGDDPLDVTYSNFSIDRPDVTPPAAPGNLSATAGVEQVELTWDEVTDDDLAGYEVLRATSMITVYDESLVRPGGLLTGTTFTDTAVLGGSPYYYAVVAVDGAGNTSSISNVVNVTPEAPAAPTCPLVSILACGEIPVELPYSIDWTQDAGGLMDADGTGTGFTAVDPPSAPLGLELDGTSTVPSFADAPGYEPSRLTVDELAGTLTIDASKGIQFRDPTGSPNTNSQLNALGVGVEAAERILEITTTVDIDFPASNNAQQGGIWFGLDEDDYVKLVLANEGSSQAKVQLLREIDAVATPGTQYELNSPTIVEDKPVTLVLRVDGVADTVSASYQVGDGDVVELVDEANTASSTALPIPEAFTEGVTLSEDEVGPVSFAGLFATSRNATTADALIDATFSQFAVSEVEDLEEPCFAISTLGCDEVPVALPFALDFDGDAGGLDDAAGTGTGFTMVDPPSARLPSDVDSETSTTPSFEDAPGYEPSRLNVADGALTIASTRGIQFRTNGTSSNTNSLLNALGVGVDADDTTLTIATSLEGIDFPAAGQAQQAGLWFGLGEDDYVKLVVQDQASNQANIQLLVERDGVVDTGSTDDNLVSGSFADDVDAELELTVDREANTVSARYRIDGGSWTALSQSGVSELAIPASFSDGVTLSDDATGPVSFAGLFATSRNTDDVSQYLDAMFSSFSIDAEADGSEPFEPFDVAINFQSEAADVPAGYLRDVGEPFGARSGDDQGEGLSYGWVAPDSGEPLSLVNNGRERERAGIAPELDTLIHLQYGDIDNPGAPNVLETGAWEIEVPNGVYEVTFSVGDQPGANDVYDSLHAINVEYAVGIEGFQATAGDEYASATVTVDVSDGRLRLDPVGGTNTKLNYVEIERVEETPVITSVFPENRSAGAAIDGGVSASIAVPGSGVGVDPTSLDGNVKLFEVDSGAEVPTTVGSSGGNDVIALDPNDALDELTSYRFEVGDGVLAEDGTPFAPFVSVFTTGVFEDGGSGTFTPLTGISFDKVAQPIADGKFIASMQFGPDGKLYTSTIGQGLFRYDVAEDGTLSNEQELNDLSGRAVVGLVFDRSSTAGDLKLWITHTTANISNESAQWNSKVSYLTGPDLGTLNDVFVGLPRSAKDHLTNSMIYGPGDDLFFLQGSNQAAGDLDSAWGTRGEKLLSAALLHFDPDDAPVQAAMAGGSPIDVQTADGGSYDPFAADAPLKLWSTGIRNAYDLVYHSNGHLYVPTNGTAGGANSPGVTVDGDGSFTRTSAASGAFGAGDGQDLTEVCTTGRIDGQSYDGPDVPAIANHSTQRDFLYRVEQGGYYGHPNPERCEFVLNEGSTGTAFGQGGSAYPAGVDPDPNYRGYAYDFEFNKSPNGVIEYQSETFGGQLKGWMPVVRFSNNNDLIWLQPDPVTGEILGAQTQLGVPGVADTTMAGVGGFKDPLEIIEDPRNGNLYVNQYDRGGGDQQLFLLRVPEDQRAPEPGLTTDADELVFSAASRNASDVVFADPTNTPQVVTVTNDSDVSIDLDATLTGPHAARFTVAGGDTTLAPGASSDLTVTFEPQDGVNGVLTAELTLDDGDESLTIALYALAHPKQEGGGEPPLIQVFEALGYDVDPGWTSLADGVQPTAKGDEVLEPVFEKAGNGPVTMTAIAAYAPQEILPFGWYEDVTSPELNEVGAIADGQLQTLYPGMARGGDSFDPGDASFGFYYDSNTFNRVGYTQDERNDGSTHRARIYPAADRAGAVIPNTYLVGFEDAFNGDYNDYVFVVTNVRPAGDPDPAEPSESIRVNFQNEVAPLPNGYLKDFGQPFGPRTGADQGDGLSYGWLDQATENPIDLSVGGTTPGNGRDRDLNADQRFDTLLHMQAGDLTPPANPGGEFNGIDAYAYWELAVPDGIYEVTVAAGDAAVNTDPEFHSINVESESLIDRFEPTGPEGTATHHQTATIIVEVTDGGLTIDANGGTNTKINFVEITPLTGAAEYRVNFQNADAITPAGWLADTGLGFSSDRGYGWVELGTTTPIDRTDAGRNRSGPAGQPLLQSFNIMQNDAVTSLSNGAWQMEIPDGVYTVEVAVGDNDYFDSVHSIEVNGVDLISEFVPVGNGDFETGSADVEVTDGLLTVAPGFNGVNTKINWIRVTGEDCEGDCFPPTVDIQVDGPRDFESGDFANEATVTIVTTDLGGSGVDEVSYSVDGAAPQGYDAPFTVTGAGEYEVSATAVDGAGNETTVTESFTVLDVAPVDARIATANMDATRVADEPTPGFWDDWLTMHRIDGGLYEGMQYHDEATLEIRNTGTDDDLVVGEMTISNAQFEIVEPTAQPFTVAPGEAETVTVRFVASGPPNRSLRQATLTIVSNDPFQRDTVIELRGLYMNQPEGNNENTATQLAQAFGYTTDLGEPLTEENDSPIAGDEVRSGLWERAELGEPIVVRQIAALHGCCTAEDRFEFRSATGDDLGGFNHDALYGQTIYPLKAGGQGGGKAELIWDDADQPFQITSANYSSDTTGNLGIRTWPVIDRDGDAVPYTWFVIQDFVQDGCGSGSANCDYNDNVYIISNIVPEGQAPEPPAPEPSGDPIRLNAGGPAVTTGGVDWAADTFFAGGKSYANANVASIADTDDDVLYLTERSATEDLAPFDYAIPVEVGTYEVRLHLAEIFFGAPSSGPSGAGNRVFSVEVEGEPFLVDYDINAEVGTMTAVIESTQVEVTDGVLDLAFTASVNQPKVSAIEVLPVSDTVRINAGGPTQLVDGIVWQGCAAVDQCNGYVSGGSSYLEDPPPPFTGIPADMNEAIFASEWTGGTVSGVEPGDVAFAFDVPVADGDYDVVLHVVELNKSAPGTRVFDVELQGQRVLEDLDLWAMAGLGGAFARQFGVTADDGSIAISFITGTENAKISAIEIVPSGEGRGGYGAGG